jgi:hypothetical protein
MVRPPIITPSAIWAISSIGDQGHRFDLRFLRPFRADLSIRKSSSFLPPLIAAASQRGLAPRPAQVSPEGPRYFGGTFFPFNALAANLHPLQLLLKLGSTVKKAFGQPASADPSVLQCSSLIDLPCHSDLRRENGIVCEALSKQSNSKSLDLRDFWS